MPEHDYLRLFSRAFPGFRFYKFYYPAVGALIIIRNCFFHACFAIVYRQYQHFVVLSKTELLYFSCNAL